MVAPDKDDIFGSPPTIDSIFSSNNNLNENNKNDIEIEEVENGETIQMKSKFFDDDENSQDEC
jgi:hypothetical protein